MSLGRALPTYLDDPRAPGGRTFGQLAKDGQKWVIRADPQVVSLAKRLFPGSNSGGSGMCVFPLARRRVGDLNWLMHRYPLEIVDVEEWNLAIAAAREHEARSLEIAAAPTKASPGPGKFQATLREYQQEAAAFLVHHRRTLLADDMGLGKTVEALAAMVISGKYPALIVVQPHLVLQWARMVERFVPDVGGPLILRGSRPEPFLEVPVVIIHYGLLRHWRHELEDRFQTVILDECQELRRPDSQKYWAASAVCQNAENVYGLSGTPIYNAGSEIWSVLDVIESRCLGDRHEFQREWCAGTESVQDPVVLGAYLREQGLMLRRRKSDVLSELPPKQRVIEDVDADEGRFGDLVRPVTAVLRELDAAASSFERIRLQEEIINLARQATGIAKAPYVAQFVAALVDAGEPGLLFAHHHAVMDIYREKLRGHDPVFITGRETKQQKDSAIQAFRDGRTDVCVVSLRAASGLDGLQDRGRWTVFGELDWSPAVHSQAEDRLHRIGLQDSVLCYYLVWRGLGSSDPDILSRLGFKASQAIGLLGDQAETEEDKALAVERAREHIESVVRRLKQRLLGVPNDPADPEVRRPVPEPSLSGD